MDLSGTSVSRRGCRSAAAARGIAYGGCANSVRCRASIGDQWQRRHVLRLKAARSNPENYLIQSGHRAESRASTSAPYLVHGAAPWISWLALRAPGANNSRVATCTWLSSESSACERPLVAGSGPVTATASHCGRSVLSQVSRSGHSSSYRRLQLCARVRRRKRTASSPKSTPSALAALRIRRRLDNGVAVQH